MSFFSDPDQKSALSLALKTIAVLVLILFLLIVFGRMAMITIASYRDNSAGLDFASALPIGIVISLTIYAFMLVVNGDDVFGNYRVVLSALSLFSVILAISISYIF